MNGLLFLGSSDFTLRQGENGSLLCLTYDVKGLTLVLFYSNQCVYCDHLIKKFKQLPHLVNGCQFAIANVSQHPDIPERSAQTMAAITYVPDLILYVNGSPYIRYDGKHDVDPIRNFILEVHKKVATQVNFHNQRPPPQQHAQTHQQQQQQQPSRSLPERPPDAQIPAYTIGKPLVGGRQEKVCYLNFNTAYVMAK